MSFNSGKTQEQRLRQRKASKKLPQPRTFFQLNCNGLFEHPRFVGRAPRYDFTTKTMSTRRSGEGECGCCPPDSYYEAELKKVFEYVRKKSVPLVLFQRDVGVRKRRERHGAGDGTSSLVWARWCSRWWKREETWLHKYGLSETHRACFSLQHRNYFGVEIPRGPGTSFSCTKTCNRR